MLTLTNHVIDRTEPNLHCSEPLALWRFSQIFFLPSIGEGQKKVLPFEHGASGAMPYGKSASGYCITFIEMLDEGLSNQPLRQNS